MEMAVKMRKLLLFFFRIYKEMGPQLAYVYTQKPKNLQNYFETFTITERESNRFEKLFSMQ